MKRVLLFAVIAVLAIGLCLPTGVFAKDWKKVRIATEGAYPPWNSTDSNGNIFGFDIDVANEVCRRANLECEIVAQNWKGIIPGLTAGKYDLIIAGMQATTKRLKVIDFAGPYAKTPGSFATLKSTSKTVKTFFIFRLCFIYFYSSSFQFRTMHFFNSCFSFYLICHLNKSKSF